MEIFMNSKIIRATVAIVLLCTANMPAMAAKPSKCEDYHQAIKDNCNSGTGGISSGSMGACFGAQIGAWIAGC
jgi:Heat-stable enterotoxin B, secretory